MPHLRAAVLVALVAVFAALNGGDISAHAGPRASDPLDGATLGDTPAVVKLSFSEKPEASLSVIRVLDTAGVAYQIGAPGLVPGDPLALAVPVRPLDRGVYIVNWRIVSAVDGHATGGMYAFGVRMAPTNVAVAAPVTAAPASRFEILARWLLITGLVVLAGAATASVARFGGPSDVILGVVGWLVAVLGVALLAFVQTRTAAAAFAVLLKTSVGRALIARAVAIGVAGAALLTTRWTQPASRRSAMAAVLLATLAAMAIHVGAGHAAAGGGWTRVAAIVFQWVHFAAVGVWLGGLVALLLAVRGDASPTKTDAVRDFSTIAAIGLLLVTATGVARSLGEVSSWDQLISSGYGVTVFVKIALMIGIATFGAVNRWRSVPRAATSLGPLQRAGSSEVALTAAALAAAAVLGASPPPAAALDALTGIDASGVDFATTVRVRLTAASDQPGPNRFRVEAVDYDSKKPLRARHVSLRFMPLDDPRVPPSALPLVAGPDDSYIGSGANLTFDGRWRVTASIERDGDSVEVPLAVEVRTPPQFVSIERNPGLPPMYTVEVRGLGHIRFSPDPERVGPSLLRVTCFNGIFEDRLIDDIVVTGGDGDGGVKQLPVRRVDGSRFIVDMALRPGRNPLAAVARTVDGSRMRASVEIDVPAR